MPRYRKVDADVMKKPVKRKSRGRPISPEQQALIKRMKTITEDQAARQESRENAQTDATETQDNAQQVLKLVGALSDNQKEVIRLKFQNGLSYRQISDITDLTVSNVGYLIHTAIQKLREQLKVNCS